MFKYCINEMIIFIKYKTPMANALHFYSFITKKSEENLPIICRISGLILKINDYSKGLLPDIIL